MNIREIKKYAKSNFKLPNSNVRAFESIDEELCILALIYNNKNCTIVIGGKGINVLEKEVDTYLRLYNNESLWKGVPTLNLEEHYLKRTNDNGEKCFREV